MNTNKIKNKAKILVTASTFPRWENDTVPGFVYNLSKRLTERFDVYVLIPHSKGSKEFEPMDNMKIYRYKYLPFNWGKLDSSGNMMPKLNKNKLLYFHLPFYFLSQLLAIRKIVKKENIDIIHSHWLIPQGLTAVLYKKLFNKNIKILCTSHGGDIFGLEHKLGKSLKKFVLNNIDGLTVVSNAIKEKVIKEYSYNNKIYVYPMGTDTRKFGPIKKDDNIKIKLNIKGTFLLFVGRLTEKKGLKYLIQAMPYIVKQYPQSKLIIIGDGILKKQMMQLTHKLKMENNITFLGALTHNKLPKYFATSDLFIGPSITTKQGDREGFGLVFAEAMSCGTPVITTNQTAITDIVKNNENGFVVEEKNPEQIAEKVLYVLKNKDKLEDMKNKAREHIVKNFDWDIIAERYVELIKELVKE
ncbi:MAG: glycosyltransferase family 4 protein [Spirochaetota bacterium]